MYLPPQKRYTNVQGKYILGAMTELAIPLHRLLQHLRRMLSRQNIVLGRRVVPNGVGVIIAQAAAQISSPELPKLVHCKASVIQHSQLPRALDSGMVVRRPVTVLLQYNGFVCSGADLVVLEDPG